MIYLVDSASAIVVILVVLVALALTACLLVRLFTRTSNKDIEIESAQRVNPEIRNAARLKWPNVQCKPAKVLTPGPATGLLSLHLSSEQL